jgi:hypothetical protein
MTFRRLQQGQKGAVLRQSCCGLISFLSSQQEGSRKDCPYQNTRVVDLVGATFTVALFKSVATTSDHFFSKSSAIDSYFETHKHGQHPRLCGFLSTIAWLFRPATTQYIPQS